MTPGELLAVFFSQIIVVLFSSMMNLCLGSFYVMSPYFSEFPSLLQPTSVRQLFGKPSVQQPLTLVEVRCNSFMNLCKKYLA